MYPMERYLSTLKSYVHNKAGPEGSIAEGYLTEECSSFCALYFDENVETRDNRPGRNYDGDRLTEEGLDIFSMSGRPLRNGEPIVFNNETLAKAHRYVFNCDEIEHYRQQHEAIIKRKKRCAHEIQRIHSESFASWFKSHIKELNLNEDEDDADLSDILKLSKGPLPVGKRYKGFIINEFWFHTMGVERKLKTQNSGVVVNAFTTSFASQKDKNPIEREVHIMGF